jgi:hypothetical protein
MDMRESGLLLEMSEGIVEIVWITEIAQLPKEIADDGCFGDLVGATAKEMGDQCRRQGCQRR